MPTNWFYFNILIFLLKFIPQIAGDKYVLCYECSSSTLSSSALEPGCTGLQPCCADPFNKTSAVKECTTGLCLKATFNYKDRKGHSFYERRCYDDKFIAAILTPQIFSDNKVPNLYQDSKSEETIIQLKQDKKCVDYYQETPLGLSIVNVCACDTDFCNSSNTLKLNSFLLLMLFVVSALLIHYTNSK